MTEPTMAALDAAVQEAKGRVEGMPTFASTWASAEFTNALNALIAAAEARGAARAVPDPATLALERLGEEGA